MLKWSQEELARKGKVSLGALKRWEAVDGPIPGMYENVARVLEALESEGLKFVLREDGTMVVLLRRPKKI